MPRGWLRLTDADGSAWVRASSVTAVEPSLTGTRVYVDVSGVETWQTSLSPTEVLRRIAEAEGGASTEGVEWTSGEEDDWNAEVAGAQCTVWPTGDGCGSWAWQTVGGRWRDAEGNCPDADGAKRAVIAVARALAMSDRGGSDA